MSKAKAKGTAWETECVRYLGDYIFNNIKSFMRLPLSGSKDVGDIASPYLPEFVFECKNRKDALSSMSMIMRETEKERENAEADFGVALVKRRNFGPGGAYVVMEMHQFAQLLKERVEHGGTNTSEPRNPNSFQ